MHLLSEMYHEDFDTDSIIAGCRLP